MKAVNRFARSLAACALLLVLTVGITPAAAPVQTSLTPPAAQDGIWNLCRMTTPNPGGESVLTAVTGTPRETSGVQDLWAVGYWKAIFGPDRGYFPLVLRNAGGAWKVDESLPETGWNTILTAVAAYSHNDVWAVGYSNVDDLDSPVVLHYSEAGWQVMPMPLIYAKSDSAPPRAAMRLTGVAAVAPNTPLIVGYTTIAGVIRPAAVLYGGDGWQWQDLSKLPDGTQLNAISATSANDVWAVGTYPEQVCCTANAPLRSALLQYDGRAWAVKATVGGIVNAVAANAGTVFAVGHEIDVNGAATKAMRYEKTGTDWLRIKSPNPDKDHNFLTGVTVWGDQVYAVGYAGIPANDTELKPLVLRYSDYSFEELPVPHPGAMDRLMGVVGADHLWVVGSSTLPNKLRTTETVVLTTLCPMDD